MSSKSPSSSPSLSGLLVVSVFHLPIHRRPCPPLLHFTLRWSKDMWYRKFTILFVVFPCTDGNGTVTAKERGSSEVSNRAVDQGNFVWHVGVN